MLSHRCLAVILTLFLPSSLAAQSPAEIRQELARPIIEPDQPLKEVQKFVAPRIPHLPEFKNVAAWETYARKLRAEVLDRVVFRGAAQQWRKAACKVEWLDTMPGGEGYRLKKVRYEALPGLWIPALFYEPLKLADKVPVALNVMGHDGNGKDVGYQQIRSINLAKRGMLVLNVEWFAFGQLRDTDNRHGRLNQLDLCGTSGLAPFYLALQRGLDVLLSHPNGDPKRVAVSGLSGGGWQTILISALDERVTLTNPVAGYSSFRTRLKYFKDLGDSEQTPCDLATVADYTHLTALLAPRAALLTYNAKDECCFEAGYALPPLVEAAAPLYKLHGKAKWLRTHVNHDPGTHNYERENREAFYGIIGDQFFPGDTHYPRKELDCAGEVKPASSLQVPLPATNATLHSLALGLSKDLPRIKPGTAAEKNATRLLLRQVLHLPEYRAKARTVHTSKLGNVTVTAWRLHLGDDWTVPAVEFIPAEPKGTILVLNDGGRVKAEKTIAELLARGQRVLALDPLFIGGMRMTSREYLFQLLVSTVGQRPLGVQTAQVLAAARLLAERHQTPVSLHATGQKTSMQALLAAALDEKSIGGVDTNGGLSGLKEVLERNYSVEQAPELFCFGLLEAVDVPQLRTLIEPRTVKQQ